MWRWTSPLAVAIVAFAAGLLTWRDGRSQAETIPPPPAATEVVLLTFGIGDREPTDWSGSVTVTGGRLVALEGWRFLQGDRIAGEGRWTAQSRLGPVEPNPIAVPGVNVPPARQAVQPVGVLLYLADGPGELQVRTAQGEFRVPLASLRGWGGPTLALGGRVRIERLPVAAAPATGEPQEDYPALAIAPDGTEWLAWVAYREGANQVFARRRTAAGWEAPRPVSDRGDLFRVAIAVDGRGRPWVVWSARAGENFDLWGRSLADGEGSSPVRLTTAPEADFYHQMATDARGRIWLTWMGFRQGKSAIFARVLDGDRWSREIRVSDGPGNAWEPAIATDRLGNVAIGWDTYDAGNYDVKVRLFPAGQAGEIVTVAGTPRFEAHVSLAYDPRNELWVAWDEAGQQWGKDYAFGVNFSGATLRTDDYRAPTGGERLYAGRRIRVARLGPTGPVALTDVTPALGVSPVVVCELPQLAFTRDGACWLFYRRRVARNPRIDGWTAGGMWELYAVRGQGNRWSAPILFPQSAGRQEMRAAIAPDPAGGLRVAWATDLRVWQQPGAPQRSVTLRHAAIADAGEGAAPAVAIDPRAPLSDEPPRPPVHPTEAEDVAFLRAYRLTIGGRTYRLLRGDLHRHTDTSPDGMGDGSLLDLYRYALDAARLDFLLVGDHNDGGNAEYPWWRREQSNDLFYLPGRFVPLYGYERSVPYPNGHRNVIFPQRGVRTLPIAMEEQRGEVSSPTVLYPYLERHGGIATGHTSASDQGTDWRDVDPRIEPVVELYQGYHTSYEGPGTPRAIDATTPIMHGRFQPAGYVWNALQKGLKLGFQASSDHISTHTSYACVWVEEPTRRGIIDALRRRHCYAATDNLLLVTRMGEGMMGDTIVARGRIPALAIVARGTAPIARVEVISREQVVYSTAPNRREVALTWQDTDRTPGERYYYVRIQQVDGQLAWASPIWVDLRP